MYASLIIQPFFLIDSVSLQKTQLEVLLGGIAERACSKWINDIELDSLQSVLTKILSHTKCLEDVLELVHLLLALHIGFILLFHFLLLEFIMLNPHAKL